MSKRKNITLPNYNIGVNANANTQQFNVNNLYRFRPGRDSRRANRWLEQFASVTVGWECNRSLDLFKSLLDGPAYDWFIGAEGEDFADVESFKVEFLKMFGDKPINETLELYKAIMSGLRKDEKLSEFGLRIRALAKSTNQTFEEVKKALVVQLPIWAQSEIQNQEDWKSIVENLKRMDERRERNIPTIEKTNANFVRRSFKNNDEKTKPKFSSEISKKSVTCYGCKKQGHYKSDCPLEKKVQSAVLITCDEPMPIVPIEIEKHRLSGLIDTGANFSSISLKKGKRNKETPQF